MENRQEEIHRFPRIRCRSDGKKSSARMRNDVITEEIGDSLKRSGVSFGTVRILEFPLVMGDHPEVSSGVPTTLDWNVQDTEEMDVRTYEEVVRSICPRRGRELAITDSQRTNLLLRAGHSLEDLAEAAMEARRMKLQRAETLQLEYRSRYWGGL